MYDFVGCLVTCSGMLHQVCSSEDMAEHVAHTLNVDRKLRVAEINERTRRTYMEFIALRDGHNVAKVA